MKTYGALLSGLLILSALAVTAVTAQTRDDLVEIATYDGAFRVTVPKEHDAFLDADGFEMSDIYRTRPLKNVVILNAFAADTLMSFERYETKDAKGVAEEMLEAERRLGVREDGRMPNGTKYWGLAVRNDNYFAVRRYFWSKKHLYVITTASRRGETAEMNRFLGSIHFEAAADTSASNFKGIKWKPLLVTLANDDAAAVKSASDGPVGVSTDQPGEEKMVILTKPRPYFTNAARNRNEEGTVKMRVLFSSNGSIQNMEISRRLNAGLTRQCAFAALRMKFLPKTVNGTPVSISKTVEYSFAIY